MKPQANKFVEKAILTLSGRWVNLELIYTHKRAMASAQSVSEIIICCY